MQAFAELSVGLTLMASAVILLRKAKRAQPPTWTSAHDTFQSTMQTRTPPTPIAPAQHVEVALPGIESGTARRYLISNPGSPADDDRSQAMMDAMAGPGLCTRAT